jgi:tetratricopeptide (TPR) repeat protein
VSRPVDLDALEAEIDRAVAVFRGGRPAQAVRMLNAVRRRAERVLAATETPDGARAATSVIVARTLVSESAPRFDITGDLESSLALLSRATELAVGVGSAPLLATIRGQRALMVLRSGDTRAALRAFDDAAALLDEAAPRDRAVIMLNRGALHLEHADLARAEADLRRSVELCEQIEDHRLASMALHNLGYVDFLAGRIPRALAALEEAQLVNPDPAHPTMLLDRARVLREAGLVRDADRLLEQAGAGLLRSRLFQDLAETEMVRADCAVVGGDPRRARSLAAAAHRRFARRGNVRWMRKAELLLLRCDQSIADGKAPRPRRTALLVVAGRADDLVVACRKEGRRDLARAAGLEAEECRLLAGDPAASAPPPVRSSDTLQVRLQSREVRALAALRDGDLRRAAGQVRLGLTELGSYQHSFGSLDLRTASAVHGGSLARLGLDVALRTGSPAAVFHHIEQARAVSTRLPQVRPPGDERTAALLSELRRVEEDARGLEGDSAAVEELAELRDRAADLQRDIRARAWEVEGSSGSAGASPRIGRVRDAARDDAGAFVSFARHQGRWVAVSVCGRRCRLHDLADVAVASELVHRVRADLDALAMPVLPGALREAVRRSLDLGLERLDDLLVGPLGLGDRPAVLSCSGDLAFLPWGLLPRRAGASTVVTPSAAWWLRARSRCRPARPTVVAVAGPDLRRSTDEARLVRRTWPGATALSGDQATTLRAHQALVSADLVHVAAHGTHRQDNPLFSSVRMADGHLYAYEIDAGAGLAGCVVLSACEAGLATLRPGDESLGLAHVLLQMGCQAVIAGVARVGDDVSAWLMERVHALMAQGRDTGSALADAQRGTLDGGSPAAFVSFGATW